MDKEQLLPENVVLEKVTMDLWKGPNGQLYLNEEKARKENATHTHCECGNLMGKDWLKCDSCYKRCSFENYQKMPFKEYDGTPTFEWDGDEFFHDEEDIEFYLEENDLEEIDLVMCERKYLSKVEDLISSYWAESLPEDMDYEEVVSKELRDKIKELDGLIEKYPSVSWGTGKYRTTYKRKYHE